MEDTLRYHIAELTKCRKDYDTLFQAFKKSEELYKARDAIYNKKIESLCSQYGELRRKYDTVKSTAKEYSQKYVELIEKFDDVEEGLDTLERSRDSLAIKCGTLENENSRLSQQLADARDGREEAIRSFERYRGEVQADYVLKTDYHAVLYQLDSLRSSTVSRDQYEAVLVKIHDMQKHIENDMISRINYEGVIAQNENLRSRIEREMVLATDFNDVVAERNDLRKNKGTLEAVLSELEAAKESLHYKLTEAESKIVSLKEILSNSETSLSYYKTQELDLSRSVVDLRRDMETMHQEKLSLKEKCESLENAKASLLTQVGTLKQQLRRENEQTKVIKTDFQNKLDHHDMECTKVKSELLLSTSQYNDLLSKYNSLVEHSKQVEEHLLSTNREVKTELDAMNTERSAMTAKASLYELENANLKLRVRELESQSVKLSTAVEELSAENSAVKRIAQEIGNKAKYYQLQLDELNRAVLSPAEVNISMAEDEFLSRSPNKSNLSNSRKSSPIAHIASSPSERSMRSSPHGYNNHSQSMHEFVSTTSDSPPSLTSTSKFLRAHREDDN